VPSRRCRRVCPLAWGLLLAILAAALPAVALAQTGAGDGCSAGSPCAERSSRLAAWFDSRVEGGGFGFLLVDTRGWALASWRTGEGFYPASSIKVLYLLQAMRWAAAQEDLESALGTLVPVDTEPCGGGPARGESLDSVLGAMMRQSDNLRANAVGDFFGLEAINQTAHELGGVSPGSVVAHRFACGGPANDPPNRMTAADLAEVYRRFGAGTLLDPPVAERFASYFLDAGTGILDGVIAEESAALGRPDLAASFRSGIDVVYKAGWWETDLSVGGYAALPWRGCRGRHERGLAFTLFVSEADAVAPGFEATAMVGEALRDEIRTALFTLSLPPHTCRAAWGPFPD